MSDNSQLNPKRITPKAILGLAGAIAAFALCLCIGATSGVLLFAQQPAAQPAPTTDLSAAITATVAVTPSPIALASPTSAPTSAATLQTAAATTQPTNQPTNQPTTLPTNTPLPPASTPNRPPVGQPTLNWKGALPGVPAPIALPMGSPEYGMQAFLWWRQDTMDRDITLVKNAGFGWVKQNLGWRDIEPFKGQYDWRRADRIVLSMNDAGMDLVVRLDFAPDWAAPGCHNPNAGQDPIQGPPQNLQDYVNFVSVVATRYRGRIRAYEIWNEPNLAREWCGRPPSGAGYTQMLKAAYTAIKATDPTAWVVSAGLSPTTRNDNVARPDIYFLQEMYDAGAARYFDLLGVHGAGFRATPEADPGVVARDPNLANPGDFAAGVSEELRRVYCFRHTEDLRAIMVKNGDTKKQVALLEFGWTSDRIHPNYAWFAISEDQKADYFVRAYKYAYNNWTPWIGLMSLIYVSDPEWKQSDEQYWWAITNPDGSPRVAYTRLKAMDKPIK